MVTDWLEGFKKRKGGKKFQAASIDGYFEEFCSCVQRNGAVAGGGRVENLFFKDVGWLFPQYPQLVGCHSSLFLHKLPDLLLPSLVPLHYLRLSSSRVHCYSVIQCTHAATSGVSLETTDYGCPLLTPYLKKEGWMLGWGMSAVCLAWVRAPAGKREHTPIRIMWRELNKGTLSQGNGQGVGKPQRLVQFFETSTCRDGGTVSSLGLKRVTERGGNGR